MAYTPFDWRAGPEGQTPVTDIALDRIEYGIAEAHQMIEQHIADDTPHSVYDDMQDLTILFENGLA